MTIKMPDCSQSSIRVPILDECEALRSACILICQNSNVFHGSNERKYFLKLLLSRIEGHISNEDVVLLRHG